MVKYICKNVPDRSPDPNVIGRNTLQDKGSERSGENAQQLHNSRPDGGYGWVVLCACFILQMVATGLVSVFGVFLPQFLDYFGAPRSKTAIIGSLMAACTMLPGPLVSVLVSLIGCRAVAMLGSLFITIGLLLSTFANSVEVMIVTIGLISGLGLGFIYLPLIVMVGFWFDKRRAIAMGITTSGAGIGVMCFGSVSGLLLENYDWRNALVFVAGITMQCFVCAALLRPVNQIISTTAQSEHVNINELDKCQKDLNTVANGAAVSVNSLDTAIVKNQSEVVENSVLLTSTIPQTMWMDSSPLIIKRQPHLLKDGYHSDHNISQLKNQAKTTKVYMLNPLLRKDIFYSGSIDHISKHNNKHIQQRSIANENNNTTTSSEPVCTESNLESLYFEEENTACSCCNSSYIAPMKKMLGCHILTSAPFLLILLANSLFQAGYVICICFVTDYAISIGLEAKNAAHMTSAFGIGTTLGRLAGGAATVIPHVGPVQATSVSLLLAAFTSLSIVLFCDNFLSLAVFVAFTGFFLAPIIPLTAVMQVEYLGLDNLTNAHGMVSLGKGIVSLFGPPVAGLLQDWTGSATPPFYLTAALLILASGLQASLLLCSTTKKTEKH